MSVAVSHKKKIKEQTDDPKLLTLSTGIEAIIIPVGATLIEEVVASIPDPKPPMWHNPDKDRDEENPNDPAYLEELEKTQRRRAIAAMEAMLVFGMELDVPEDDGWIKKLRFLEKRGAIDLSNIDFEDEMERDLAYKKFVAVGTNDLILLGEKAGLRRQDVEQAAKQFQS